MNLDDAIVNFRRQYGSYKRSEELYAPDKFVKSLMEKHKTVGISLQDAGLATQFIESLDKFLNMRDVDKIIQQTLLQNTAPKRNKFGLPTREEMMLLEYFIKSFPQHMFESTMVTKLENVFDKLVKLSTSEIALALPARTDFYKTCQAIITNPKIKELGESISTRGGPIYTLFGRSFGKKRR